MATRKPPYWVPAINAVAIVAGYAYDLPFLMLIAGLSASLQEAMSIHFIDKIGKHS